MTAEGRQRYRDFRKTEKRVRSKLSNVVKPFEEKPIDKRKVKERGGLSGHEADECISIASKIFERAESIEPDVTRDVISSVEETSGEMYGLDNRLKQPTSLAAKIGSDAKEKGITFEQAAKQMRDVLRYTSVSEDKDFTKNYNTIIQELSDKGYSEVRCRNYFDLYRKGDARHKAVQCVFENKNGDQFELQFQTPSSQASKELKLPLYEERRKTGLSDQRKAELEKQMTELAERVNDPKNVFSILSHG